MKETMKRSRITIHHNNGHLKSAGHFVTIEQEIPFDKIVELKQAYS